MKKLFSEDELKEIKEAVQLAEKSTSAEIVPVFFESCGNYADTYWKSGIFFTTIWSFLYLLYYNVNDYKWPMSINTFFISQLIAGILGVIAVYFLPVWKRALIERVEMKNRIRDVAYRVFLEETVFNTKDRTGMLLFMSFFEKEAVILGDEGINNKISQGTWESIIESLVTGMKKGSKTKAIIDTIHTMGNLLTKIPIKSDDKNELGDDLRIGNSK